MLAFIYRTIRDFEQQHGLYPNILYLNSVHSEHLQEAFSDSLTMQHIARLLNLEMIIDEDVMHPHVAWAQSAQKQIA